MVDVRTDIIFVSDYAEGFTVPWSCPAGAVCYEVVFAYIPVCHDGMAGTVNGTRIPEFFSEHVEISSDILEFFSEYANTCDGIGTPWRRGDSWSGSTRSCTSSWQRPQWCFGWKRTLSSVAHAPQRGALLSELWLEGSWTPCVLFIVWDECMRQLPSYSG